MKKLMMAMIMMFAICAFATPSHADLPIWSGVTNYAFDGGGFPSTAWTATITWEVYAPGSSYIGTSSHYLYYYTIKNTSSTGGSITDFSLGNPFLMPIYSASWMDTGGVTPSTAVISFGQVAWSFAGSDGILDPGDTSDRLYMESLYPEFINGGLIGSGGTDYRRIPGPGTPEPTSMALLGLGLVGFVGSIRRKFKS